MLVDAFVGRQPIFDRDWNVAAYEVLYRSGMENRADFSNPSAATSQVLVGTFIDIDIDRILGNHTGFINMSREFLVDRFALAFPPERMVVEVLEDVQVDDEVISALTELSEDGYRIALDDFVFNANQEALLLLPGSMNVDVLGPVTPRYDVERDDHARRVPQTRIPDIREPAGTGTGGRTPTRPHWDHPRRASALRPQ